ncbi:hypothetical protein FKP32DRAFT_1078771 [Trametes sanguinea]|nr:hypothetical protein FKP32DRAFT_1078771 [Trametes sanguinea]
MIVFVFPCGHKGDGQSDIKQSRAAAAPHALSGPVLPAPCCTIIMALDAFYADVFGQLASGISDLTDERWFDTVNRGNELKISHGDQLFRFRKLGYTQLGSFEGIGYQVRANEGGSVWTFWIVNPTTMMANKRALLFAIRTAIDDPNTGKLTWTVDASHFASA